MLVLRVNHLSVGDLGDNLGVYPQIPNSENCDILTPLHDQLKKLHLL